VLFSDNYKGWLLPTESIVCTVLIGSYPYGAVALESEDLSHRGSHSISGRFGEVDESQVIQERQQLKVKI
jgi:hypothetical protein